MHKNSSLAHQLYKCYVLLPFYTFIFPVLTCSGPVCFLLTLTQNKLKHQEDNCLLSANTPARCHLSLPGIACTYHIVRSLRASTRRLMCRDKSSINHKMIRILLVVSVKDIAQYSSVHTNFGNKTQTIHELLQWKAWQIE